MVEEVRLRFDARLIGAALVAVLTSLLAQGVLSGWWQAGAVAAIAGVGALLAPVRGEMGD